MRDHDPVLIEEFNGLWARGDNESCPQDHFTDCLNIQFSQSSVEVRSPILKNLNFSFPIKRVRTFIRSATDIQLLVFDSSSRLWAVPLVNMTKPTTQINIFTDLSSYNDFAFNNFNGRAYLSFFKYSNAGYLLNSAMHLYKGDYTQIREAGGTPPLVSALAGAVSATAGNVDAGIHYLTVAFETDTGYLTQFYGGTVVNPNIVSVTAPGNKSIDLTNIPTGDSKVVARVLIATKVVIPTTSFIFPNFNVQFFFIPGGRIGDNTTTSATVNFYDSDLIADASYLQNLTSPPQGGTIIFTYHNRLGVGGNFVNPDVVYLSNVNDPETFDAADGLLEVDVANKLSPVTHCEEYRDVLYVWKINKTYVATDNGDVPSSWPSNTFDDGIGAFPNGVAEVLDAGGRTVDALFVYERSGVYYFNGSYQRPEVTWKIVNKFGQNLQSFDPDHITRFSIVHDSVAKKIYITMLESGLGVVYLCDYSNTIIGMPDFHLQVKWAPWKTNVIDPSQILIVDKGLISNAVTKYIIGNNNPHIYGFTDTGGGTGKSLGVTGEDRPTPFIQTALIGDGDENIIHFGGMKIVGNGLTPTDVIHTPPQSQPGSTLGVTIYDRGKTRSSQLTNIYLPTNPSKVLTLLGNFSADKFLLKLSAIDPYNQYFNFNRLIPYVRPIYSQTSSLSSLAPNLFSTIIESGADVAITSGAWTPAFGGTVSQSGQVYTFNVGRWVKIADPNNPGGGGLVLAQGNISLSTLGSISGSIQIKNLPFNAKNLANMQIPALITFFANLNTTWVTLAGYVSPSDTSITVIGRQTAGTTSSNLGVSDLTNTTQMIFHLVYESEN